MKLKRKEKPLIDWDQTTLPEHLKGKKFKKFDVKAAPKAAAPPPKKRLAPTFRNKKEIDEAARSFLAQQELERNAKRMIEELRPLIISTAEAYGVTNGKTRTMQGTAYEIGFLETEPSPKVDVELARSHLPEAVFRQCAVEKTEIDEKKLETLVEAGVVKPAILKKICKTPPPQRRIHVKKI